MGSICRKMQCDCDVVRDDDGEIEQGCLDDCANRMLMIECGKDCLLESYCAIKGKGHIILF